jgi:hypothetical protein
MARVAKQLERLGITPERFRVESVSATEGAKWSRIMKEMSATVRELGVEAIQEENEQARPKLGRKLRRMAEVPDVQRVLGAGEAAEPETERVKEKVH